MSRFLIATAAADGHVNPALPIARALVERGHEVAWYTGRRYRDRILATGARFEPIVAATEPDERSFEVRFPERSRLRGLAGLKFDLKHLFLDEVPSQIEDMRRILHSFPADVVLGDTAFFAAGMLHELGGPRWATFGISALPLSSRDTAPFGTGLAPSRSPLAPLRNRLLNALADRVLFRDVQSHLQQVRTRLGLPPSGDSVLDSTLSPYLYMQSATPAFEYPRRDLPPQVQFIGPLLPNPTRGFEPPVWWGELAGGRPVVLVNQGTVATDPGDLIIPAMRALEGEDVLVVVTTGGLGAQELARAWSSTMDEAELAAEVRAAYQIGQIGGFAHAFYVPPQRRPSERPPSIPVPTNVRAAPFLPFGELLPHVDLMVTNGGYGGVQFALAHGVPLVVAGATEEKPEIAARVAWSGAGIDLRTSQPSPSQLRRAVRAALSDPRYRQAARRIRDDYAAHSAPAEAASLLERLASTGRPVLRGAAPARPLALRREVANG